MLKYEQNNTWTVGNVWNLSSRVQFNLPLVATRLAWQMDPNLYYLHRKVKII